MKRSLASEGTSGSGSGSSQDDELVLSTKPSSSANASTSNASASASPTSKTASASGNVNGSAVSSKKPKLASIFLPKSAASKPKADAAGNGTAPTASTSTSRGFKWLEPIGSGGTCLHGVFGEPAANSLVALYDLDGTIVRPKGGKTWPSSKDEYDYEFILPNVLDKIRDQHSEGYSIVIVTNQKQTPGRKTTALATWKRKMALIAAVIDVPLRVFAALADDEFRKPRLGIWSHFTQQFNAGIQVDHDKSFYVGDAAGRTRYRDHNDTDLKWALNAQLRFYTPQEYFDNRQQEWKVPVQPWTLSHTHTDSKPGSRPVATFEGGKDGVIDANHSDGGVGGEAGPEIVLFVGPPASGKTLYYQRHFAPRGYEHVNQDVLRTRAKCLSSVEASLNQGRSCVVDNTNRDAATRRQYIDLANRLGVRVRCFYFDVPLQTALHNNAFRALHGPVHKDETKRELVPQHAITAWYRDRTVPDQKEGFAAPPTLVLWEFVGPAHIKELYELYYH
ncbi:PNK3P-domain-containing protein [Testicularia cyperi]|uniref:PNK3P-domain-containing protein n=1 Tax=Testicularia cyperi TaxID=1882483 RepID=A0A317XHM4_9BASI|nr:PNK3P-domain-containing protein [Testicularia cyperi]